ncbi:MAG: hypothetical protein ACOYMP_01390 [Nodosilinea sp.]
MANPNLSPEVISILKLLREYSFDIDHYASEVLISQWIQEFGYRWVGNAITEALYQGRYKIISIDHILQLWQRRGQPIRHFSREFESIILGPSPLSGPTNHVDGESIPIPCPPSASELETPAVQGSTISPNPIEETPLPQGPLPSSPIPVPDFRPILENFSAAWMSSIDGIPPFVPRSQSSDLHQRLRAVVQSDLEG